MKSQFMLITPAMAKAFLSKNTVNRPLRLSHVRKVAQWIRSGIFRATNQGIGFDEEGNLVDGQHRLHAVIETGAEVKMLVVTGLPRGAFYAIDTQAMPRKFADVLGMDRKMVEVCTAIGRYILAAEELNPTSLNPFIDTFGPMAASLLKAHGSNQKFLTTAPIRASAVLRAMNHPEHHEYVFRQYGALARRDYLTMSPATASLVRQLENGGVKGDNGSISGRRLHAGLRAWRALDPLNRDITKVQIKETEVVVAEIGDAIMDLVTGPGGVPKPVNSTQPATHQRIH